MNYKDYEPIYIQRVTVNKERLQKNTDFLSFASIKDFSELESFDRQTLLDLIEKYNEEHSTKIEFLYFKIYYDSWEDADVVFKRETQEEKSNFKAEKIRTWESNEIGYDTEWHYIEGNDTSEIYYMLESKNYICYLNSNYGIVIEDIKISQSAGYYIRGEAYNYYKAKAENKEKEFLENKGYLTCATCKYNRRYECSIKTCDDSDYYTKWECY